MYKTTFQIIFILAIVTILFKIMNLNFSAFTIKYEELACWLYPNEDNRNAELLKIILTIIGGIGVFFTLYLSYKRAKAGDKAVRLQGDAINKQSEQLELTRKSQIDERFKNAVEHLGNDKEPIILGGIVELHQIAKEEKDKYAPVVFNILTSYLRSILKVNLERDDNFSSTIPQTIIDFLFRGNDLYLYKDLKANLGHCNLNSLDINGSHFIDSDFSFSLMPMHIFDVSFENSKFSRTNFTITKMKNVNFRNADFHDNLFNLCEIYNGDFSGAKFINQFFLNNKFFDCTFSKTDIYGTEFLLCHFQSTFFHQSELLKLNFSGSNFINCDFSANETMSKIDFIGAGFYETSFENECFECDFSGARLRYPFDFIQPKDLKENINKPINKEGIKELDNNLFINCVWEKFSEENYNVITEEFNTAMSKWEEKYTSKKETKKDH
jgi:uncharacterized protein YjbI with pentapeptide repeats